MQNSQATNVARSKLSDRQQRFVDQYIVDLNAAAAYMRSGYSSKGRAATNAASRLLANAAIQSAIQERLAASRQALAVGLERLELELQRIAMIDIRRLFRPDGALKAPHELDPDVAAAVASFEVREVVGDDGKVTGYLKKVRLWDKVGAIVDLLKRRDLAGQGELGSKNNPMTVKVIEIVRPASAPAPPAAQKGGEPWQN